MNAMKSTVQWQDFFLLHSFDDRMNATDLTKCKWILPFQLLSFSWWVWFTWEGKNVISISWITIFDKSCANGMFRIRICALSRHTTHMRKYFLRFQSISTQSVTILLLPMFLKSNSPSRHVGMCTGEISRWSVAF